MSVGSIYRLLYISISHDTFEKIYINSMQLLYSYTTVRIQVFMGLLYFKIKIVNNIITKKYIFKFT